MTKSTNEGGTDYKGFNGKRGAEASGMKTNAVTDSLRRAWRQEYKNRQFNKKK